MIGKKCYVFTNWGLVKATIVKERVDNVSGTPQYKVAVDINRENKAKDYGFWFIKKQLNKFYFTAIVAELFKPFGWWVRSLFKGVKKGK